MFYALAGLWYMKTEKEIIPKGTVGTGGRLRLDGGGMILAQHRSFDLHLNFIHACRTVLSYVVWALVEKKFESDWAW